MKLILESLKGKSKRPSTQNNYLSVWRKFNGFVIKLDNKPDNWEDRISLFGAYLVELRFQSSTLKSYYSAIKAILRDDGYIIDDTKVILTALTRACRIVNDQVRTRLPIRKPLLKLILFEVQRTFAEQPYLDIMYKSILLLAYYGLFRISEITTGAHPIKAIDVHIATNKNKMLFVLRSSKTHNMGGRPQKVKVTANSDFYRNIKNKPFFCLFRISREYLALRGNYADELEPFFIFRDKQPVTPSHVRQILRNSLIPINLDPKLYGCHSLRGGRCVDLASFGYNIEQLKTAGRWRSNAVYRYLKN